MATSGHDNVVSAQLFDASTLRIPEDRRYLRKFLGKSSAPNPDTGGSPQLSRNQLIKYQTSNRHKRLCKLPSAVGEPGNIGCT